MSMLLGDLGESDLFSKKEEGLHERLSQTKKHWGNSYIWEMYLFLFAMVQPTPGL